MMNIPGTRPASARRLALSTSQELPHLEWTELFDPESRTLKPAADLRQLLEAQVITPDKQVASYCNGGARGALGGFVLRLFGHLPVRLLVRGPTPPPPLASFSTRPHWRPTRHDQLLEAGPAPPGPMLRARM